MPNCSAAPATKLGFRRPRPIRPEHQQAEPVPIPLTFAITPSATDPRVELDQRAWRQVRSALGRHRRGLATLRRLTFRKLIGDPFDLSRRPLMGAIGTLTIRGGNSPSVLHQRDSASVAGGGGMVHLLLAGIFQPSSVIPAAIAADFSIWRNIQREYAEELLGHDEYDGSGKPIRYDELEPFATMDQALQDGRIRLFYLGVTLDALTLAGDILTVAIISPDTYDQLFANAVEINAEGAMPARAFPFEQNTLNWLNESKGCLQVRPQHCTSLGSTGIC